MSILRPLLLAFGLAVAAAVPASAAITALPTVHRTLSASRTSATCAKGATATTAYTAPMAGFVTARLDAAGGEWDLYVGDATSHRSLGSSRAFGSHEVVQTWVTPRQRILLTGCRTAGSVSHAVVSVELLDAPKPAPAVQSLVRTGVLSHAMDAKLESLGFDVTESQYRDHTDILVPSAKALGQLGRLGIKYRVRVANLQSYDKHFLAADAARTAAGATSPLPDGRTDYRFLSDYQADMQKIIKDRPDIARPVTIGTTYQGRPIQGIEFSHDVNATDDGKPTFFLMGVHHAREWPAGEMAMEFAELIAKTAGTAAADNTLTSATVSDGAGGQTKTVNIDDLLNRERIVVVPIINEDGFYASRGDWAGRDQAGTAIPDPEDEAGLDGTAEPIAGGGVFAYRRKNCDAFAPSGTSVGNGAEALDPAVFQNFPCYFELGVDPNRNYGFDWGGPGASNDPTTQVYRGSGQWSEPETQAVWHYSQTHPVTALITLHTVAALVLRSPGLHTHGYAPDELLMRELGGKMAKSTGYTNEFGWQLYDTTGTTEDWNYGAAGALGYTIEIGDGTNGLFHDVYQQGVVDQWTGKKGTNLLGGMHDALLVAASYAADPRTHSILTGTGTPGATLEVKKSFTTDSSPICTVAQGLTTVQGDGTPADCAAPGAVFGTTHAADGLDYKTVVPSSGAFTWHITQSTRPFVGFKFTQTGGDKNTPLGTRDPTGKTEAWTLTCTVGGNVVRTQDVVVDRGQTLDVGNACA
jgi:hypothetical protein